MMNALHNGWDESIYITVTNIPNDNINYKLIDGQHRHSVVLKLKNHENPKIRDAWKDFLMPCKLYKNLSDSDEIALSISNFIVLNIINNNNKY